MNKQRRIIDSATGDEPALQATRTTLLESKMHATMALNKLKAAILGAETALAHEDGFYVQVDNSALVQDAAQLATALTVYRSCITVFETVLESRGQSAD